MTKIDFMIECIEGATGLYDVLWYEWTDSQIEKLYFYVCTKENMQPIHLSKKEDSYAK